MRNKILVIASSVIILAVAVCCFVYINSGNDKSKYTFYSADDALMSYLLSEEIHDNVVNDISDALIMDYEYEDNRYCVYELK